MFWLQSTFMLKSVAEGVVGSRDLEGSCHLVVKCEQVVPARPLLGSSDLMGYTYRGVSVSIFHPSCVKWSYLDFPLAGRGSWHEKESSRNGWHVCRLSWSCQSRSSTWHVCLWGMSPTYSGMLHTQSARSFKDSSFLESSFCTVVWKSLKICRTNFIFIFQASLNSCGFRHLSHRNRRNHLDLHNSNFIMPSLFISLHSSASIVKPLFAVKWNALWEILSAANFIFLVFSFVVCCFFFCPFSG